ncbi:MAG: acyl-CoA desaturase [Stackebrandtia sp.]
MSTQANAAAPVRSSAAAGPKPLTDGKQSVGTLIGLWFVVALPFAALIAAVPVAWGWGLNWVDLSLAFVMYMVSGMGVTIGFHRYLTHGGFKAKRWVRVSLAVAGSLALQGPVIQWVADHRRHHAYSDLEGDPHSPWRYGEDFWGLTKGLAHAHVGWLFHRDLTNQERFTPDLLADKDLRRVDKLFGPLMAVSLISPAVIGGLLTWSLWGAVTAFFWAGAVRVGLLHHITWSVNSICHVYGERPFAARDGDKASNFWPLALLSFGESWHNLHHADPTCARHGVMRGQVDITARTIWCFEKFGWVSDVRWPKQERLEKKLLKPQARLRG